MSFLDPLEPELREALLARGERRELAAGEILFDRGDPAGQLFLVEQGCLEALDTRARPPTVLARLAAGRVLGELGFIDGAPRSARVQAREASVVVAWSAEDLRERLAQDAPTAARVWRSLAELTLEQLRLRRARERGAEPLDSDAEADAAAVARHVERLAEALEAPPIEGHPDPVARVLEGLCGWLQHQGREAEGLAAGARLREALAPSLGRSRTGALALARAPGVAGEAALLAHVLAGEAAGEDPAGVRLDRALLDLPTPRALRWRARRMAREVSGDVFHVAVFGAPFLRTLVPAVDRWTWLTRSGPDVGAWRELLGQEGDPLSVVDPLLPAQACGLPAGGPADLIVVEGIADSLPDAHLAGLLDWASKALRPGGRLVVGALGPSADDGLFDLLLDWPMVRREARPTAFLLQSGPWLDIRARVCAAEHGAASFVTAAVAGLPAGTPPAASGNPSLSSELLFGTSLHDHQLSVASSRDLVLGMELATAALQVLARGELDARRRAALREGLARHASLSGREAGALLNSAVDQAIRAGLSPAERRVLSARHGPQARALLEAMVAPEVDLAAFGEQHGHARRLHLLEIVLAAMAADGEVDGADRARLREAAEELNVDPASLAWLVDAELHRLDTEGERHPLVGDQVLLGRDPGCDVVLPDPQVARCHARLTRVAGTWHVHALAHRPVRVDGRPVRSAPLEDGSQLHLGARRLVLQGRHLVAERGHTMSALVVRDLRRTVAGRTLLQDVRFTGFAGELIALIGPSGCGKTTLLDAIRGLHPADRGEVRFDGRDFHQLLQADPTLVGEVPQDDLVLPELTVEESLTASARLRLAGDAEQAAVVQRVDEVLELLDLSAVRSQRVGDPLRRGISGGQRKRVNLGQELITRTTQVLFLDEPTSGLDPRGAADVARVARQLADDGRLVFLVTHDLAPGVLAQVDQLLVLAPGGRQVWFGPPAEAIRHFGASEVTDLFDRLGERSPETWGALWKASAQAERFGPVREALADELLDRGHAGPSGEDRVRFRGAPLRQLLTLSARYLRTRLRDRTGAGVWVLQPVVLAAVMVLVFSRATVALVFMLSLSCLWFGMSAGVREFIADRSVWRRERRVGVGVGPYVASKAVVLCGVVLLQCVLLTVAVFAATGLSEHGFGLLGLAEAGCLAGVAGLGLGLLVSAVWSSSEAAVGTLILLLVPQIAFSGILMPIRDMHPIAAGLTWVTPSRYALDLSLRSGEELSYLKLKTWYTRPIRGELHLLGLRETDSEGLSPVALRAALVSLALALLLASAGVVWRRDRPRRIGRPTTAPAAPR